MALGFLVEKFDSFWRLPLRRWPHTRSHCLAHTGLGSRIAVALALLLVLLGCALCLYLSHALVGCAVTLIRSSVLRSDQASHADTANRLAGPQPQGSQAREIVLQRKVRGRVHIATGGRLQSCDDHVLIRLWPRDKWTGWSIRKRQGPESFGPWRSQRTPRHRSGTGTVDLALRILEQLVSRSQCSAAPLGLSWSTTAAIRRIPVTERTIGERQACCDQKGSLRSWL